MYPRASLLATFCTVALTVALTAALTAALVSQEQPKPAQASPAAPDSTGPAPATGRSPDNPYNLDPFHADFPVELEYPVPQGLEYERTRRQALERVVANLEGSGRREPWLMAMEFFWHGPDDAVEPLVEAMDRAFGNPGAADVVKNCCEAMGKMANERLDRALQRALEHKNPAVRQAAFASLATSGALATLKAMFAFFPQMNGRARGAWLRAARMRLGADAVPMFQQLMNADFQPAVRDQVLQEALQYPAAQAATILSDRWSTAVGEFKPVIAGVLHAAGDTRGSVWLREMLQGEDLAMLVPAIRHAGFGELGILRDSILRLSSHPRSDVRLEVAKALTKLEGDDIAAVYELLAAPDETMDVKSIALRELTRRGRPQVVSSFLEELPTATGTRARFLINMLAASGDPRAVPIFVDRFQKAPTGEGRPFLQALALSRGEGATSALLELFLGPEIVADRSGANGQVWTTLNYLPTLLLNLHGTEAMVVQAFQKIPKSDWKHRAALLSTIAGLARDREEVTLRDRCLPVVRSVLFDREDVPQMRVLALNLLMRRFFTIDDAMKLKNTRHEESPQLRILFADFLNDYF
jgi:HEAT repeat protein